MQTTEIPLISCIMPTYGRPAYVGEAIAMFLAQDYPSKELIVLNDCPEQTFRSTLPGVHIVNVSQRYPTLGEKRNAAIAMSKGEIIAVWDDDDAHLPWRLSFSMAEMLKWNTEFYRPAEFCAYWGEPLLHDNQSVEYWMSHGSVMFTRGLWERVGGYPPQGLGEDAVFFERIHRDLSADFIKFPIPRDSRFFVLRGTSQYAHMSISGGAQPLDTSPLDVEVEPITIQDPILLEAYNRLIENYSGASYPIGTTAEISDGS